MSKNKEFHFDDLDKALSCSIPSCRFKAFELCYAKENDDDYCEICMLDAICHLKRCLRNLRRQRSKDGKDH